MRTRKALTLKIYHTILEGQACFALLWLCRSSVFLCETDVKERKLAQIGVLLPCLSGPVVRDLRRGVSNLGQSIAKQQNDFGIGAMAVVCTAQTPELPSFFCDCHTSSSHSFAKLVIYNAVDGVRGTGRFSELVQQGSP